MDIMYIMDIIELIVFITIEILASFFIPNEHIFKKNYLYFSNYFITHFWYFKNTSIIRFNFKWFIFNI